MCVHTFGYVRNYMYMYISYEAVLNFKAVRISTLSSYGYTWTYFYDPVCMSITISKKIIASESENSTFVCIWAKDQQELNVVFSLWAIRYTING